MSKWPKLSETLPVAKDMMSCQRCGKECDLERWEEHDDNDEPTGVVVCICDECSALIIEKHPRLYRELHYNEPHPGSMPCCYECPHRSALTCTHPALKANGGGGLMIKYARPQVIFWDGTTKGGGRRTGGQMQLWPKRPECLRVGVTQEAKN